MNHVRPLMAAFLVVAVSLLLPVGGADAAKNKKGSAVTIVNQSDWEIHYFYLSPNDKADWGPDQLSDDQVIEEGDSFTLQKIPCDSYDVKIVDEDDDECVIHGVQLCGGSDRWVITSRDLLECQGTAAATNITVVNDSWWEIYEFYLSPADDYDWGDDQLGDEIIETGDSFTLTGIPCDDYDVKLIDEDDDECIIEDVEICDGSGRWEIGTLDLLACQDD